MLGICLNAFSQYRVVNTEQRQQSTNTAVEEYDSTYNFGIRAHNKKLPTVGKDEYYKRFIGQEIIFYKRANSTIERPTFYSNFRTTTPYAVKDTIWKKRRPVPKPKDYEVVDVQTDYYKAEHTNAGWVACCGVPAFMFDGFQSSEEKATYHVGYFTPYTAIEGKTFKILSIREGKYPNKDGRHKYLIFTLLDEDGQRLLWYATVCDTPIYQPIYPCIVKGYLEKMQECFLGKEMFYLGHYSDYGSERYDKDIKRYKVKELIFAECNSSYSVPAFLVERYPNGENATIALCKAPDLFRTNNYDRDDFQIKNGVQVNPKFYDDILSTMIVEEGSVYLKKLEKDKERHLALMKKYGTDFGTAIYFREVRLGMTSEMVLESLGRPTKINTTKGSYGEHQQWCYEYSKRYLYFENGKLTDIQQY